MNPDVTALQNRLIAARRDRDRAQGALESAKQVAQAARAELQEQFGVSTVEEAEQLAGQLQETLDQQIERLSDLLDQIGA